MGKANSRYMERYHSKTMTAKLGPLVDRAVTVLGATLEGRSRTSVDRWLALLERWNARIDLTSARSPEMLVDLMLADAIVLARRIEPAARVMDVGTGAGAPGLALALMRPDVRITLVEPNGKRASFLRTVIGTVDRSDIALLRARAQDLSGSRAWDATVSRATFPPSEWLDLATKLTAPGGSAWLLLSKEAPPQHERAALAETVAYEWPLTGAGRVAARYVVL
jgi:16S rRNA (guanine527-N7)-methyltransferase